MSKILIIDDDSQLLQLLNRFFSSKGYEVTTADNGKKALTILKGHAFDVVITDIIMPEADGIEVLTAVAKTKDRPIVIAMSGGSQRIDAEMLLMTAEVLKADKVIAKPLPPDQLLEAVETLLPSRKSMHGGAA